MEAEDYVNTLFTLYDWGKPQGQAAISLHRRSLPHLPTPDPHSHPLPHERTVTAPVHEPDAESL